jgi:hypothetical protein
MPDLLQSLPASRNVVSDFNKTLTASELDMSLATLCRVCAAVISDPMPAVIKEQLGGLDLREFAQSCTKYRVWEKPAIQPGWVQIFGSLPALSVNSIGLRSDNVQRCALLITVAGLERRIGRLFKDPECGTLFQSQSGIRLSLTGFNIESLQNAKIAADTAKQLKWTEDKRLIVASRRFGGQRPSALYTPQSPWLDGICKQVSMMINIGSAPKKYSNGTLMWQDSLGQILHGSDLEGDCVGLLVECF